MSNNEICDIIKRNRPKVSASTISTYCSRIRNLSKAMGINIKSKKDIIKRYEDILKHLETYNINNRKTILSSLIVVVDDKAERKYKGQDKCLEKLRMRMDADLKVVKKKDKNQELTASQKENYIPWKKVLEIYDELEKLIKPIFKKKGMTLDERVIVQKYVILSLYVLLPPRRIKDYLDVKVKGVNKEKDNWIKGGKNPQFYFNSYKNGTKLGVQIIDIPVKLWDILKTWLYDHRNTYLIHNSAFKRAAPSFITKVLNGLFDAKISVSLLRHIYLTEKFGGVDLNDLKEITTKMGNSEVERSLAYVSKEHAKEEKKKEDE